MDLRVGLCAQCQNAKVVQTERSTFYLCEAARTEPRLAKYPRLPVLSCFAHVAKP